MSRSKIENRFVAVLDVCIQVNCEKDRGESETVDKESQAFSATCEMMQECGDLSSRLLVFLDLKKSTVRQSLGRHS